MIILPMLMREWKEMIYRVKLVTNPHRHVLEKSVKSPHYISFAKVTVIMRTRAARGFQRLDEWIWRF